MRELKILDYKACLENAPAIMKGIKDISYNPGHIRWELNNIGISWTPKGDQYWNMREHRVGKVGDFEVFYNQMYRYITIFSKSKQKLVAYGQILKNGKLAKDHITYDWNTSKDKKKESDQKKSEAKALLRQILNSMVEKINQKNKKK